MAVNLWKPNQNKKHSGERKQLLQCLSVRNKFGVFKEQKKGQQT